MQDLFHASDIDGSGQIDYEQFIAAMLDSNRVARRKEAVRGWCGCAGHGLSSWSKELLTLPSSAVLPSSALYCPVLHHMVWSGDQVL